MTSLRHLLRDRAGKRPTRNARLPLPRKGATEDKRLERLYDYTKWHLGIYLATAGGLGALLVSGGPDTKMGEAFGAPWALGAALLLMMIAGISGAVIASSAAEASTFPQVWEGRIGPMNLPVMRGKRWAAVEHGSFWISVFCVGISIWTSPSVAKWIDASATPAKHLQEQAAPYPIRRSMGH